MDNPVPILIAKKLNQQQMNVLADNNLQFTCTAFIEIVYGILDKQRILELLKKNIDVVITSQHGVGSLLENFGKEILAQATWKIHCIGFATKEKVQTYFTRSKILNTAKNIDILSDKMIANGVEKYYFFGSHIRQQYWIDKLQKNNKQIEEYEVYNTLLKSQKIEANAYKAIVFFSPSAVDSFFLLNRIPTPMLVFAIGHTTAQAIAKYTEHHVMMPLNPTLEDLQKTIQLFFK